MKTYFVRHVLTPFDAGRVPSGDVNEYLPKFKQMVAESGPSPAALPITLFGGMEEADLLKRYLGYGRGADRHDVPAGASREDIDRWAELIRHVNASA